MTNVDASAGFVKCKKLIILGTCVWPHLIEQLGKCKKQQKNEKKAIKLKTISIPSESELKRQNHMLDCLILQSLGVKPKKFTNPR
jgi:hypothetical protein